MIALDQARRHLETLGLKLDFAQFKRRKRGNRQAGGRERSGLSVHQGRRRTVKNPQTPATGGGAPERWHPRRSAAAWRTKAVRWAEGRCCRRRWAARVVQEKSPMRSTGNGQVRPLALGLHAQVSPHLLKGDLQLPAQDKPFQDPRRVRRRIGAEQGLGSEFALWVPDQDPAQGHRRLARAVPDCRLRREFHRAGSAVVPGCRHLDP